MDQESKTSFIPKQPFVAEQVRKPQKGSSFVMIIAVVIFFASLISAGGVYFYRITLEKSVADMASQLERVKASFEPSLISDMQTLDRRISSAEQVLALVNEGHTVSSKATVYNTLGLFARKGLVREVIIDPNKVFYDTNLAAHYHFYNEDTGALEDINVNKLDISKLPEPPEGTQTEAVDVIIRLKNKHNARLN